MTKNEIHTISIENLTVGYRTRDSKRQLASHMNASLQAAQLTFLLGVNGVGKSTLLRTLSGFLPALEGEVYVKGQPLSAYSKRQLATLISVVLTDRAMIHHFTVRSLVGMGRSPYTDFWGTLSKEDERAVEAAIRQVGIEDLADRMIDTLSDGERQKVMIAKAIAQDTPILFLDEPTAFLDYPSKVEIMLLLRRLCYERSMTIFLSTHDLELALQIADNIWLMTDRGLKIGTPQGLSADGSLSDYFVRPGIEYNAQTMQFKVLKEELRIAK